MVGMFHQEDKNRIAYHLESRGINLCNHFPRSRAAKPDTLGRDKHILQEDKVKNDGTGIIFGWRRRGMILPLQNGKAMMQVLRIKLNRTSLLSAVSWQYSN
ncbi:hypothetical protein CEXT_612771 [Caerostris extrusa]|uniref:Uncharacterized protein n=1 Tax=Caerostris extrusa TaxID=172846 RepID=A0AAV4MBY8_CAEEX|nr:hypothetical protein CEXT_612771 [Caerostris extrusa]